MVKNTKRWTRSEEDRYIEARQQGGLSWREIAKAVGTRDAIQCRSKG